VRDDEYVRLNGGVKLSWWQGRRMTGGSDDFERRRRPRYVAFLDEAKTSVDAEKWESKRQADRKCGDLPPCWYWRVFGGGLHGLRREIAMVRWRFLQQGMREDREGERGVLRGRIPRGSRGRGK
jgi:hypothetical protein